jgi:hypothetical protein
LGGIVPPEEVGVVLIFSDQHIIVVLPNIVLLD